MRILLLALLALLGGCVIVPNVTEEPFVPEKEEFIVGVTTWAQVKDALAEPVYESAQELHYYDNEVRFFAMALLPGGDIYIDVQAYYFVLRFDESGLLSDVEWQKDPTGVLDPHDWSIKPLAQFFAVKPDELRFVSPGSSVIPHEPIEPCREKSWAPPGRVRHSADKCPPQPRRFFGVLVLTPAFVGFARWVGRRYEILWQVSYSAFEEIKAHKCGRRKSSTAASSRNPVSCELLFVPFEADGPTLTSRVTFWKDERSDLTWEQKASEFSRILTEIYN